jgi:hypothetical protein
MMGRTHDEVPPRVRRSIWQRAGRHISAAIGEATLKVRAICRGSTGTTLVRQAFVYTIVVRWQSDPFLLLPVLTRFMASVDYGIVSMFLLMALILDPFISLGFPGATVMYYDKSIDLPAYLVRASQTTGIALVIALPLFY